MVKEYGIKGGVLRSCREVLDHGQPSDVSPLRTSASIPAQDSPLGLVWEIGSVYRQPVIGGDRK